jgi:hypothetical protein
MRWAVELVGEHIDLDTARELFKDGAIRIETLDDNAAVLVADEFETLLKLLEVYEAAKSLVDLINGALFLHDASRIPVGVGSVVREYRNGKWHKHAILTAETAVFRTRFFPPAVSVDGVTAPAQSPPERKWTQDALADDVVADVFSYLRGKPDWFELYKAFERMRDDINRRLGDQHQVQTMGWPAKSDIDHFSESANVYRHSPAKWTSLDPTTAMKLGDARLFVRGLARNWLKWRI